ncbi:MAG: hypothetical protein ACXV3C_08665 [Actinomycetes bacterium]
MTTEHIGDDVAVAHEADEMVEIQLLGYPVRLGRRSTEHYNDIFREFALLASDEPLERDAAPARLLALVDALGRRYPPQLDHEAERDEAFERGDLTRDFVIEVPRSAGEASEALGRMLDDTDEFCRQGKMLTLAAPEDVVAFRRWYLEEVINQSRGGPPTPWTGDLD